MTALSNSHGAFRIGTMHGFSSRRTRLFLLAWLLGLLVLAAPPAQAKPAKAKMLDLTDTVFANRIMTKFALLVRTSDLATFLSSRGPFTLFAPTDSAFSKIPPDEFAALLRPENQDLLQRIVLFHLVNGNRYSAKDLLKLKTLPSCEGTALIVHTSRSGAQFVQKAKILRADLRCENGLIQQIDTVLIPPGLVLPGAPGASDAANAATTNSPATGDSTNAAPVLGMTNAAPVPAAGTNSAP
jgi:transforming growth factor-beta-induced protein